MVDHQQVKADDDNLIIARRTHEPIISHKLFTAVQEYRKQVCEESRAVPKRPYTPNIFKGKVFCADCGRSLHRQRAERKKARIFTGSIASRTAVWRKIPAKA